MGWPLRRRAQGRHAAPRSGSWVEPGVPPVLPEQPVAPVELGFRDGSRVTLAGESPHARALRAVADVLVTGGR